MGKRLVKLPARLQSRGYFCLKESIREPLGFIWLCLKEPKREIPFIYKSMQERHSPIHRHNKRYDFPVFCGRCMELEAFWHKMAENSISRVAASLTNLSGFPAQERIGAEVEYLTFEYLSKRNIRKKEIS